MSYCRFMEADAYIYDDVQYGIICCACSLMPARKANLSNLGISSDEEYFVNENFIAGYDYDAMLAHIAEHRKQGDEIPSHVDEDLIFERDCKHDYSEEGTCSICLRRKILP